MQALMRQILIISILFMGTEGAWDLAIESHAHGDQYAYQSDSGDQDPGDPAGTDPDPLPSGDSNHCGHSYHGDTLSIVMNLANSGLTSPDNYYALNSTLFSSRSQAPPTPPPNV